VANFYSDFLSITARFYFLSNLDLIFFESEISE